MKSTHTCPTCKRDHALFYYISGSGQKALLMDQLVILHQRIRYREEAIRALSLQKAEALQFSLPGCP